MLSAPKIAKSRASRNRSITIADGEKEILRNQLIFADSGINLSEVCNKIICGDAFEILKKLPQGKFDLLFADPPYNLTKNFGSEKFRQISLDDYEAWLESWLRLCVPLLTPMASVYICGDWRSSSAIQRVGIRYFHLQNRI